MRKSVLYLLFVLISFHAKSQLKERIDSLRRECNREGTPAEKIVRLGKLSELYFVFKQDSLAADALNKQLEIAAINNDPSLMKQVLFGEGMMEISSSASKTDLDRIESFAIQGLQFAREEGDDNLLALAYIRLSKILLKRGNTAPALSAAVQSLTSLPNVSSDSIKILAYINLADVYLDKGEATTACTNLNNAFDMAVKHGSVILQSNVYHRIAEMYYRLGHPEESLSELKKSLLLNTTAKNGRGIAEDFYDMARYSDEKYFIAEAIHYADSLHLFKYLLNAKRLMIAWYEVVQKNSTDALSYLKTEKDLYQSYINSGMDHYYTVIGNIYYYSGNGDSAVYYYKKAEPAILKKYDDADTQVLFEQLAAGYSLSGNNTMAIDYYLRSLDLCRRLNNKPGIADISQKLGDHPRPSVRAVIRCRMVP